jgi:HK97 gp10 family phage protein
LSVKFEIDVGGIENFHAKMMHLPESVQEKVYEALNSIARDIVIKAKALCPVRTGRLMQSIYAQVTRDMVLKVGAYAPYAIFQELGTRNIPPRQFLTRAVLENAPRLVMLMYQAFQLAAEEAAKINE